jgi:hypothetical protein
MSWLQQLQAAKAEIKPIDPWEEQLQRIRGAVGTDGVARISTEKVFDALDLPPFQRTAEAGRRLKALMLTLGWTPMRARAVTSRGRGQGSTAMPGCPNPGVRPDENPPGLSDDRRAHCRH